MNSRFASWILLALLALLAAAVVATPSVAKRKGNVEIRIVATTDIKGELEPCG
jgi:uncharacterized protein HemY